MNGQRRLTKIRFLDKPEDYPGSPRSASMMLEAPARLRVALHLQAVGVYEIMGDDDRRQADLWREVRYWRVRHVPGVVAEYTVVQPDSAQSKRDVRPIPKQGKR